MLKKHKILIVLLLSLSVIFLGKDGWCAFEYMDGKLVVNGFIQSQIRVHCAEKNPHNNQIFGENDNNDINMFRNHLQLEINYDHSPRLSLFAKIKYVNELNAGVDKEVTSYDRFPNEYPGDLKIEDDNNMLQVAELYADVTCGNWWFRLGKQQVSWGQTDGFTLLDIINPNDLSWRLISDALYEGHDNVRESLFMVRANYSIPFIDAVDNPMLELLYIPTFVPKFIPDQGGNPYNIVTTVLDIHNERPDGNEWGAKFSGLWGRLEFSLNYFRARSDNAIAIIPGTLVSDPQWGVPLAFPGLDVPPAGLGREDLFRLFTLGRHPLQHHLGFSFSYDDTDYLGGVWRVEFLYEPDRPYERGVSIPGVGTFTNAMVERIQTVKYMIGFDRPTFIRALNPRRTFSLGFQLFQTLVVEDHDQLDDDFITLNGGPVQSLTTYMTFLIDTQYAADRIHPILFAAYDPRGGYWIAPQCEFLWGDNWRFYILATFFGGGDKNGANDSLGLLDYWDDVMFRVTYQF